MHARTNGYFLDSSVRNRFSSGAVCAASTFFPGFRDLLINQGQTFIVAFQRLVVSNAVLHRLIKMPIVIQRGETPVHVASRARCCRGQAFQFASACPRVRDACASQSYFTCKPIYHSRYAASMLPGSVVAGE